jgi:hypothetical protein
MNHPPPRTSPSSRQLVGVLALIALLTIYAFALSWVVETLAHGNGWLQLLLFGVGGVAWIFPARPLLRWMLAAPKG